MPPPPSNPPNPSPPPTQPSKPMLRILLLHGYTQTPPLFRAKLRALEKHLIRTLSHYDIHFSYPAGPHKLSPKDVPGQFDDIRVKELEDGEGEVVGRAWWRRRDYAVQEGGKEETEVVYEGLEEGLAEIARCIREEGPFDGVVGFSQGACAAGMVASLLEGEGRWAAFGEWEGSGGVGFPGAFLAQEGGFVQQPLRFCVSYCGFKAPGKRYASFYEPRITTPVLHVLGALDTVVEEERSWGLVEVTEGGERRVVRHPGGHFVPSGKVWLDAVAGFVRECMEGKEGRSNGEGGKKEEEKVEDMEVPF